MATQYMVQDVTKAKADFIAKMDKQKTIWLEGSLVKTKHKYFDLYKMVHPELGEGDELVEYNSKRDKWSLANGYSSTKIYTSSPQNSLQELRDRKHFIKPSEKSRRAKAAGQARWRKKKAEIENR